MNTSKEFDAARKALLLGFDWSDTLAGQEYWNTVYHNLIAEGEAAETRENGLSQDDIVPGQKFRFIRDSVRNRSNGENLVYMKVDVHSDKARAAVGHFMEVATSEIFEFYAGREALVLVED